MAAFGLSYKGIADRPKTKQVMSTNYLYSSREFKEMFVYAQ